MLLRGLYMLPCRPRSVDDPGTNGGGSSSSRMAGELSIGSVWDDGRYFGEWTVVCGKGVIGCGLDGRFDMTGATMNGVTLVRTFSLCCRFRLRWRRKSEMAAITTAKEITIPAMPPGDTFFEEMALEACISVEVGAAESEELLPSGGGGGKVALFADGPLGLTAKESRAKGCNSSTRVTVMTRVWFPG